MKKILIITLIFLSTFTFAINNPSKSINVFTTNKNIEFVIKVKAGEKFDSFKTSIPREWICKIVRQESQIGDDGALYLMYVYHCTVVQP